MVDVVIGSQWGDEGKGKIVDLLSEKADVVVRFHGGNNAGHTVVNSYGTFPLHLIPAGIFNPLAIVLITNGVVLDLAVLNDEIDMLGRVLPDFADRMLVSPRCHVIMPYHKVLDRLYEDAKGKAKTGTTGRGIGPAYADKVSYNGIRLSDFTNPRILKEKLEVAIAIKNKIITALGGEPLNPSEVYRSEQEKFRKVKKFVKDTFVPLHNAIERGKHVLMEGAHGMFLDNDFGTYPFVTASNVVAGAVTACSGVPPHAIGGVTGVVKAYTTRVGQGPFPTELFDRDGDALRSEGHEFGTTTGRPRRCGWFDAELVCFAAKINGFTTIAVTKLDVLDAFDSIKFCIGYTLRGKRVRYIECSTEDLSKVKPVYKEMKGWRKSLKDSTKFSDLPKEAQRYVLEVENEVGVPVSLISVGPGRNQTIRK